MLQCIIVAVYDRIGNNDLINALQSLTVILTKSHPYIHWPQGPAVDSDLSYGQKGFKRLY